MTVLEKYQNKLYHFKLDGEQHIGFVTAYSKLFGTLTLTCSQAFTETAGEIVLDSQLELPPEWFDTFEIIKIWERNSGYLTEDSEREWFAPRIVYEEETLPVISRTIR